jgi:hypothetical protein
MEYYDYEKTYAWADSPDWDEEEVTEPVLPEDNEDDFSWAENDDEIDLIEPH